MINKFFSVLAVLVVIYLVYGLFLYFFQFSMIYHPSKISFFECDFFSEDGKVVFNGTRFYYRDGDDDLVVIYHGNAGRACDRRYLLDFLGGGFSYLVLEYSGYGEDKRPSKDDIFLDVRNVVSFLDGVDKRVFLFGESLGGSVASYHASMKEVDGVILVSTFHSIREVARRSFPVYPVGLLLREDYDTSKYLEEYSGRVLLVHGERDRTVALSNSLMLHNELSNSELVIVSGADHNNLYSDELFVKIRNFIKR